MRSAFTSLLLTATIGLLAGAGSAVAAVTPTGSLTTARSQAAGVTVPSGATTASVLALGGRGSTGTLLSSVERYTPATGTWVAAAPMRAPRTGASAFYVAPLGALTTAQVVVLGGTTQGGAGGETPDFSVNSYDPATNAWDPGTNGPARQDRTYTPAEFRGNPQILATGGQTGTPVTVADVDVYDVANDTWTAAAPMQTARRGHAAVTLPDGRVLVAGGYGGNGTALASTELYDPSTNTWTAGPTMSSPRARFTLSVVDAGHVLAVGGAAESATTPLASFKPLETTESFDPATNSWSSMGALSVARFDHEATVVRGGWLVVTGGRGAGGTVVDGAENWTPDGDWAGITGLRGNQTVGGPRIDHVAAGIPQSNQVLVAGGGVPSALVPSTVIGTSVLWTPDAPIVPPTTPVPTTPGPTTPPPDPAPTPVQGRSFVAGRASGNVFIRIGTTDEYRELTKDEGVPFGTVIDATDGHVRVTAIVNGKLQTAEFWGGTFIVNQAKDGWIEVKLFGTLKCKNGKPVTSTSKKAVRLVKRKSKPKAWGDGKGRFRTRGKHSSATVTGTRWLVEERCTGTFTRVSRGSVRVRDFPKHKNVRVKAGKTYLARPARK